MKPRFWRFAKWIPKVLFSPFRAFEEVVRKPDFKGPILILLIMLPLTLGGQYFSATKFYLETPTPKNDGWTEQPHNSLPVSWSSNGNITISDDDYVKGNYSVSSSLINTSQVWMQLANIENFNCSDTEYCRLSFSTKWINEANSTPAITLQLFSLNNESRFELLVENVEASSDIWSDVSVDLATNDWTSVASPSWGNITGIGFQFKWVNSANHTIHIDDIFFGKFVSISSSSSFGIQLMYLLMRSSIDFLLRWVILSGIVLLALRSFSDWNGVWQNLLGIVGYVFSPSIVYLSALALLFFLLPPFFLPFSPTSETFIAYQSSWGVSISVLNLLFLGWTTILCIIAVKQIHELSWTKATLIGLGGIVLTLLLSSFLLSAFF